MYPFVVKVKYWNDYETPWTLEHLNLLLYADTMAEAVERVESRYVDNIESIKATARGDECQLFEVSGAIAKALIAGGGNYREGLKIIQEKENVAEKM